MAFASGYVLGQMIGGFLAAWVLQGIIDWAVVSRVMDDPFKGKLLATIIAYSLLVLIFALRNSSIAGLAIFLPGAILVGWLELRKARKMQARMDELDQTSTFE